MRKSSPEKQAEKPSRPGPHAFPQCTLLPVALGDTLQLVLLLDGIRVAAALGGVDQLLSEALSDGLDVAERRLTGARGKEGDGLVDTA